MAVSKKRRAKSYIARKPAAQENPGKWNVKLNGSRLAALRKDPDFRTIIKLGRVMNAVLFASESIGKSYKQSTVLERRQYWRASFMLAGYVHEGIKLVSSIKGRYLTMPEFQDLRAVALDAECRQARDYVRKVRNHTAFHFDEDDARTAVALAMLKPTTYILNSGDRAVAGAWYFDFADYLDLTLLVDEFGEDGTREESINNIFNAVSGLSLMFLEASAKFYIALVEKTNLADNVYGADALPRRVMKD